MAVSFRAVRNVRNARRGRRRPRVAIIGAGFAGVAAAVTLNQAGLTDFDVFESSAGPGGVWWDNRYPGAEVDTPSHMYSFSFQRFNWSRSHAKQAELQRYLAETIENYDLGKHFHYNQEVHSVRWDEVGAKYLIELSDGVHEAEFVISAVGMLNVPRHPDWLGLSEFAGRRVHTAEWDDTIDLSGKRVAIVGSGSTAAQLLPAIADTAKQVYLFQREPGWINPKPITEYSPDQRTMLTGSPWRYKLQRLRGYLDAAGSRAGGDIHIEGSASNQAAMENCVAFIERALPDRPDLQAAVTPTYGYFGKRPIKDSNFYPTLLRDDVELVASAVSSVTRTGVVDTSGVEREVDVLVTATGFQPTNYLARLKVFGRNGRELHDYWGEEPRAYLGIAVPGFPNFFMSYGPNTNSPVTVFMLEAQARFAARSILWTIRRHARSVEVREPAFERYDRWLQRQMVGSVWATANNYFHTATGRVVTQWPVSPIRYWLLAKLTPELSARTIR